MKFALVLEISNNPHFDQEKILTAVDLSNTSCFDLVSSDEINSIETALLDLKHTVIRLDGPHDILNCVNDLRLPETLVFNKSRGFSGLERKIVVPALCDYYSIPYIGSSGYAMTLARNKYHTNRLLAGIGINVPFATIVPPGYLKQVSFPDFPVIVKPNHEAGALGISVKSISTNKKAIIDNVEYIHSEFNQPVIVEEYISGEEFKVAVIGNGRDAVAMGCVGVMHNGKPIQNSLQTREDVVFDRLSYYIPKSSSLVQKAMKVAIDVHMVIGCRDYSRIDFRVSANASEVVCMEVSTQPDMGKHSSFISAAKQKLKNYRSIIKSIYTATLNRYDQMN